MFTSITNRKSFGATYEWAVLSVLPMDADKERHGLRVCEVNQALGMPQGGADHCNAAPEAYGSGRHDPPLRVQDRQAPLHHLQAGDATAEAGAPSTDALGTVIPCASRGGGTVPRRAAAPRRFKKAWVPLSYKVLLSRGLYITQTFSI